MKENTFDVPAYHFYILKKTTIKKEKEVRPQVFYVDKQVKKTLIPFENVDGLLVNEVKQILGVKTIIIACTVNNGSDEVIISEYHIFNDEVMLDKNSKKTIDKLCEEYMEEKYINSDENTKRMYRCFFERYQDGSYEKTKERIKKLEMRK